LQPIGFYQFNICGCKIFKILDDYPESDNADDTASELAGIYERNYYKDYEAAAFYYVKCYNLNENTGKPARFKAARVYDKHLEDYVEAGTAL